MPHWSTKPPKDDAGYFDLMSRAIFTAGLNWRMAEKKWPDFEKAFDGFAYCSKTFRGGSSSWARRPPGCFSTWLDIP